MIENIILHISGPKIQTHERSGACSLSGMIKLVSAVFFITLGIGAVAFAGHYFSVSRMAFIPSSYAKISMMVGGAGLGVGLISLIVQKIKRQIKEARSCVDFKSLDKVEKALNKRANANYFRLIRSRVFWNQMNFKKPFDLHTLHYCLTDITDKVLKTSEDTITGDWKNFLNSINQELTFVDPSGEARIFDCSREIDRLEGRKIELLVEELSEKHVTEDDLKAIYEIGALSFSGFYRLDSLEALKRYLFKENQRCFIARDSQTKEICGLIESEELSNTDGGKSLLIHSLARRPEMAKVGITEKFNAFLKNTLDKSQYKHIVCQVDKKNTSAKSIYEKLGFQIYNELRDRFEMVYREAS